MFVCISIIVVSALILAAAWSTKRRWDRECRIGYAGRTGESDDFMEESRRIIGFLEERMKAGEDIGEEAAGELEWLKESSEIAALSRYAHFGGVYITVEQIPSDGHDADSGNPDVFKTDMEKAARRRDERKEARYRRC